jgi:hypothetical protein
VKEPPRRGEAWPGAAWHGVAGQARLGEAWLGSARRGAAWRGAVWWPALGGVTAKQISRLARAGFEHYWDLYDPSVLEAVDELALDFCRATLDTASRELGQALEDLREALRQGVKAGRLNEWLTRKVAEIFASTPRAYRIAQTEGSRAVHAGQLFTARELGATVKTWLASADACDRCLELADVEKPLDEPFTVDPAGGPYAVVQHPPLHPHCLCTISEEV